MKLQQKKVRGIVWDQQEPGWWVSDVGGVCKERGGMWWFHPRTPKNDSKGPFKSMQAAMEAAGESEA